MAERSAEIVNEGAEIVWVLEADRNVVPGTVDSCNRVMDDLSDPAHGWCVGDGETEPEAGVFDDSPFSKQRGFDMIVTRRTMEVIWVSNHGSTAGNENLTGDEVLRAVRDAVQVVREAE